MVVTMIIKHMYITTLIFPVAHYISDWRPVTRTFHLIVFLLTDSGVVGIGEGTPYWSNIAEDYAKTLSLAKKIRELDLEDSLDVLRTGEYEEFKKRERVSYGAYLALESAVVHALSHSKRVGYEAETLGGVYRTEIPIAYTIFLSHPKTMARKLESAIKSGYKHVKLKIPCNLEELEKQLRVLDLTRKHYSEVEVTLRVDANGCFSTFEQAERALLIMEKYGVNIVEQPMPRDNLKDIAKLRKRFHPSLEIMLDESLRKPSDIELFASMEVADIVNFHPSKLGCLTITRETILKAQKLGMKANIGSALMTEIGLSHYLNLAASIPHLDYPLEEPGLYNVYGYGITQNPPEVVNGGIILRNVDILDIDYSMVKKFSMTSLFREHLLMLVGKVHRSLVKNIKHFKNIKH